MRPRDESVFEFTEMGRDSRWEGRERHIEKVGGTPGISNVQELPQARHTGTRSVRQIHTGRMAQMPWVKFWQALSGPLASFRGNQP
jgi:hypothetical protein